MLTVLPRAVLWCKLVWWYVSHPFKGEEPEGLRNQSKVTQLGSNSGLLPLNSFFSAATLSLVSEKVRGINSVEVTKEAGQAEQALSSLILSPSAQLGGQGAQAEE